MQLTRAAVLGRQYIWRVKLFSLDGTENAKSNARVYKTFFD
jgi:hypothetical protein